METDTVLKEVFISYASRDQKRVLQIVDVLEAEGVSVWMDRHEIRQHYGEEIVQGIKGCKVLVLMCSDASLRSKNVKQEIQLAWKYDRPYLPLLLEQVSFPEQLQYWLEGWQWIEVMDRPVEEWLPAVLQVLAHLGVQGKRQEKISVTSKGEAHLSGPLPMHLDTGLKGLQSVARFTDQIWPMPVERSQRGNMRSGLRDLGAPQEDAQHGYRLGSRVSLAIESDRQGHLLLLDEGTSGKIYCLCPSWFAPDTHLRAGRTYLPQADTRYEAFAVSGQPGREHLLAIVTDAPLSLDWLPADPKIPSRVLSQEDIDLLLARLRELEGDRWTALSTYFDVV